MNIIKAFFDSQRPHFSKGGKLQKFYAFFEAMETVFFASDETTHTPPFVRDSLDTKRYMAIVVFTLVPLLFFGIYNAGFHALKARGETLTLIPVIWMGLKIVLPIVIVSYVVGFFWEIVFAVVRKHPISEGLFVTAMLFPLTLPPSVPLWQVAIGISFGVVIGKEIFGGSGRNFLNPALTGRAFLFFAYPAQLSGESVWVAGGSGIMDAVSGATPLSIAAAVEGAQSVQDVLLEKGYSFSTLFFGLYPDSIGASSTFLCLAGAVVLITLGVASYKIILADIVGILATGLLLNLLSSGGSSPYMSINPFYHLVLGGAAFGIVFMTTDPVSAPDMEISKWIYGFLIGMLTVLIRVFNPAFPEGIMLSILFMNIFAPLIDYIVIKMRLKKRIANV